MADNFGSFKTLEKVKLKSTQNIEINGHQFETGEIICSFDNIQISGLNELKTYIVARGGFNNAGLVYWENTKEVQFNFSQGVFSNTQFALLNNSKVIKVEANDPILITLSEELESDENMEITPSKTPVDQIFIYDKSSGEKLNWTKSGNKYKVSTAYQDVIMNYRYNYLNGGSIAKIGQRALLGFLELEGQTRVKDDTSGEIRTGIIKIPKLKLMSGLSIRLGNTANPIVGNFQAVGLPVGSRGEQYVVEFCFLNNDIDSL